ncbi:Uncharacterised protein [Bordetella pertussis]|nr:Uncharacterised protein [Bordetella pertussis]CFP17318.1 Uncharacterised protein [Bordetella pertussis]CPK05955.1 Uncharacterised protein [Bordetella pertussis]CPP63757.1 Uncharacterised protein [Bordetella pertussis]CPP76078.1 Uncharacterised protein [Bordetella pertussis]
MVLRPLAVRPLGLATSTSAAGPNTSRAPSSVVGETPVTSLRMARAGPRRPGLPLIRPARAETPSAVLLFKTTPGCRTLNSV